MKYALETWNTESMERVLEEKARQGKLKVRIVSCQDIKKESQEILNFR